MNKVLSSNAGLVLNCPTGSLAALGLARAYAVGQGSPRPTRPKGHRYTLTAVGKARAAYQDFFTLAALADPRISSAGFVAAQTPH